jgi:hypothetical protein
MYGYTYNAKSNIENESTQRTKLFSSLYYDDSMHDFAAEAGQKIHFETLIIVKFIVIVHILNIDNTILWSNFILSYCAQT